MTRNRAPAVDKQISHTLNQCVLHTTFFLLLCCQIDSTAAQTLRSVDRFRHGPRTSDKSTSIYSILFDQNVKALTDPVIILSSQSAIKASTLSKVLIPSLSKVHNLFRSPARLAPERSCSASAVVPLFAETREGGICHCFRDWTHCHRRISTHKNNKKFKPLELY